MLLRRIGGLMLLRRRGGKVRGVGDRGPSLASVASTTLASAIGGSAITLRLLGSLFRSPAVHLVLVISPALAIGVVIPVSSIG